jgi:hypothetical protein
MATQTGRARAIAVLILASGLLYAQCGGNKTTSPTPVPPIDPGPINPNPNPGNPIPSSPQIFSGAGDIGWNGSDGGQEQTANLLKSLGGTIFTAGDNAYLDGSAKNFADYYNRSWGQFLGRTRPVPGNHEYDTDHSMSGYFGYYTAAFAGNFPGYYSYPLGDWYIFVLNSSVDTSAGSAQAAWLRNELIVHPNKCTMAMFHFPLFTSGQNGPITSVRPLWQILYDANVDVIVNGHDHLYERFFPQDPTGFRDNVRGITEFIVGTGGAIPYRFVTTAANSASRISGVYGVLSFTLFTGYDWRFIPTSGGQTDSGHGECH